MKSLRQRIVLLLILAIVTVVGLATFAASRVLQPPPQDDRIDRLARQLLVLVAFAEKDPQAARAAGLVLRDTPQTGDFSDRMMSERLSAAFHRAGSAVEAQVNLQNEPHRATASLYLGPERWLVTELNDFGPPPGGWIVLAGWGFLIVLGAACVSIFAAAKIIRPLQLLQDSVGRVGPDGTLPHIEETGSGEIRATAQAINRLSARLKTAMESRMRLVAAAGHDLRTPMTRMRLRAEFITDEVDRQKWLSDLEELDQIADSAIRLVREEVNDDKAEKVELGSMLCELVEELRLLGHPAALAERQTVTVSAAPLALKRALRNLVINAATHGGGASVRLAVDDNHAIVSITDEGPGIPENLMEQVFEPFFRVDAARRKAVPGAGLGLAIAREIFERFGGSITIANRRPHGLEQTIRLLRA
jgi:signal transduction histidine kinase